MFSGDDSIAPIPHTDRGCKKNRIAMRFFVACVSKLFFCHPDVVDIYTDIF
jgi:hypothetical protein